MSNEAKTEVEEAEPEVLEPEIPEIEEEGGEIARMCNTRYRGLPMISSMDLESPETRLRLFNAGTAKATPLGEMVGKRLKPADYLAERVRIKTKDGSKMGCRLTLWDSEGNQYFTSSESIVTAFDRMVTYFGGNLEGLDGLVMEIGSSVTKGGNRWYTVSLVEDEKPAKPKSK